ncbi:MAG: YdbH domain-containing protein [Bdellovibrionales bacterium]|nr:YdbH domain-containing protein [Bdellovibrionales bacterium]
MRNRKKRALWILFAAITALLVGAIFMRQVLLTEVIHSFAKDYGLDVKFSVKSFGWQELHLSDVQVNDSHLPDVTIHFSGKSVKSLSADIQSLDLDKWLSWSRLQREDVQETSTASTVKVFDVCSHISGIPLTVRVQDLRYSGLQFPVNMELKLASDSRFHLNFDAKTNAALNLDGYQLQGLELFLSVSGECKQPEELQLSLEKAQMKAKRIVEGKTREWMSNVSWQSQPFKTVLKDSQSVKVEIPMSLNLHLNLDKEEGALSVAQLKTYVDFNPLDLKQKMQVHLSWQDLTWDSTTSVSMDRGQLKLRNLDLATRTGEGLFQLAPIVVKNKLQKEMLKNLEIKGRFDLADLIKFQTTIQTEKERHSLLQAQGTYDLKTGHLQVSLPNQKLLFQKSQSLSSFLPFLKEYIEESKGTLHISGNIKQQGKEIRLKAKIAGENINISSDDLKVRGFEFHHEVDAYPSLSSPKRQKILVKEIVLGKKFQNLQIDYQLKNHSQINVESVDVYFENAHIHAKDFQVFPAEQRFENLNFLVEDFTLQTLLRLFYDESVSATGTLSGYLMLAVEDKVPLIRQGQLLTREPGTIWLRPQGSLPPNSKSIPTSPTDILKNYLYDFHYTQIDTELKTDKNYILKMTMRVLGKNPQYLDGKPLKLSINLELNVKDMLMSALMTYDIPPGLKRKLLKVEK